VHRIALLALLCLVLATGLGCFKSSTSQASSESSSDSSRSSSRSSASSSGSSSPSSREGPYQQDVRDYTSKWVIAEKHGITNYEADQVTWVAIGMGLKKSGIGGERFQQVRDTLAAGNAEAGKWIDKGYKK
jgi:hypothetical protein